MFYNFLLKVNYFHQFYQKYILYTLCTQLAVFLQYLLSKFIFHQFFKEKIILKILFNQ